jgi:ribosomal protein L16 Arg81 hydroxylase
LHHDDRNILFAQIYGRKHVRLIAPYYIDRVYNDREWYSPVDLDAIDYKRFPLMRGVPVIDIVLEPGECVFLPLGWWHWVKSLDVSISLSFTNFCVEGGGAIWECRY